MQSENPLDRIIGKSKQIRDIKDMIGRVARFPYAPVLITGETGTGKELVADALYACSPLNTKTIVRLNCSAIPETLIESTLFGKQKGAFTGASSHTRGLVEEADGGVLFLDEIGEMDIRMQPKLLRFLENGTFRRIGGIQEQKVDVWVIVATNRDLKSEISTNNFRDDLYFRLKGVEIHLPPLRNRRTDIPALLTYFTSKFMCKTQDMIHFTPQIINVLKKYHWPGNVRELFNLVKYLSFHSKGEISIDDLPKEFFKSGCSTVTKIPTLEEIEQEHIKEIYQLTGFKINKTAELLDINRKTLRRKLQGLEIN